MTWAFLAVGVLIVLMLSAIEVRLGALAVEFRAQNRHYGIDSAATNEEAEKDVTAT